MDSLNHKEHNLTSPHTFSGYTEKNLYKLYRVLKGRSLYPNGYESNKYKTVLFEMMKNIEIILHKKNPKQPLAH